MASQKRKLIKRHTQRIRKVLSLFLQITKPDGYFRDNQIKLFLPDEARQAESKLRKLGQGKKVDAAIGSMNRAAEDALIAKRIFY